MFEQGFISKSTFQHSQWQTERIKVQLGNILHIALYLKRIASYWFLGESLIDAFFCSIPILQKHSEAASPQLLVFRGSGERSLSWGVPGCLTLAHTPFLLLAHAGRSSCHCAIAGTLSDTVKPGGKKDICNNFLGFPLFQTLNHNPGLTRIVKARAHPADIQHRPRGTVK